MEEAISEHFTIILVKQLQVLCFWRASWEKTPSLLLFKIWEDTVESSLTFIQTTEGSEMK